MEEYVKVLNLEKYVEVYLEAGHSTVLAVGQKLEEACQDAYMNGYNWEALLRWYLEKNAPGILEGMKTDPEADVYVAYWDASPENVEKAKRFTALIRSLIEHEEELCSLVRENSNEIEWD